MSLLSIKLDAVERGLVPDWLVRVGIRRLCAQRLRDCERGSRAANQRARQDLIESMRCGPIALVPEKANEQHYELPAEFFAAVLGPRRKYSSCYWEPGCTSLADAEADALRITCERAGLADGQDVLELGCGWGSLTLWMAERFPQSHIVAVSNSNRQRRMIDAEAMQRGLTNVQVITADMNQFTVDGIGGRPGVGNGRCFDRVVSVEMFEHMRNYERLLERIASWLKPDGKLFVHHFCHRQFAYPFETKGEADWMSRHFFTGGLMPSEHMLSNFDQHLRVAGHWNWDGTHYQRTSEAWLTRLDAHRDDVLPIFEATYGRGEARRWFYRWRVFFLAVAELFGYANGKEWLVSHTLLVPK